MNKNLRVSIVIPVYNEAEHLDACLQAIADQKTPAFEVIVVDNNSADDSAAIALKYPFVTLLHEKRQGVVFARNCGFDAARGEIIGRIDADSILPGDWVANVQQLFDESSIDAVSGAVTYHDLPWKHFLARLDLSFRQQIANGMGEEVFLYGANMAMRRSAWRKTRNNVCLKHGLHEDFDLAIHAHDAGAQIAFNQSLVAEVSLRRFNTLFKDYYEYVLLSPRTYALHGRKSQRHMYPVVSLVIIFYWLIKLVYRAYDPQTDKLSLRRVISDLTPARVNPATYGD